MQTILNVQGLEKYYGKRGAVTKALDGVSFSVQKGEFVGIMGVSGSGKTTLLNCISTIDMASSGKIEIEGTDLSLLRKGGLARFRRERLGFIFQDFNLLDTLTGFENIALALAIQRVRPDVIERAVQDMASRLDISQVLNKFPYQMSGGEKQRVASARAMITNPALILADEPTGALDSKSARMLLDALCMLNEKLDATILMVTHDAFTASYAHRILFIKDGKIFNEILRGEDSRKEFFAKIIDVVTLLGGDSNVAF